MGLIQKAFADAVSQGLAVTTNNSTSADFGTVITKVTGWIGGIGGVIVFFYLIYGGFMYMTAAGNPDSAKKGGQIIVNAVIGLIILVLAYAITRGIVSLLNTGA